jgi:hypothetical protein
MKSDRTSDKLLTVDISALCGMPTHRDGQKSPAAGHLRLREAELLEDEHECDYVDL